MSERLRANARDRCSPGHRWGRKMTAHGCDVSREIDEVETELTEAALCA